MPVQSFFTCRFASGCFDPCCDGACPKHGNINDPCDVEQGSNECFKIVCPTCKNFQEKDNVEKYTDENILLEAKNATDGMLSELVPETLGRPLCMIMIGDVGWYVRDLPAFDGDYEHLIDCLNYIIEDYKKRKAGKDVSV